MKKNRGFTLIELMVVVAVVAILATIAMPSYTAYVTRGKITEATVNLADLRVKMEQWYQDSRTYVGGPCIPAASAAVKYFTFSCTTGEPTATTFKIQAVGSAAQGMSGFTYTIDQSNNKVTVALPAGWGTPPANCWAIRQGGSC